MESTQTRPQASEDSFAAPCVVASAEELRYALELRERLRRLFPNRPAQEVPIWSVGAD